MVVFTATVSLVMPCFCVSSESVILGILLQKFSFQAQEILPPERRHMVFFSIIFKCIATFSEESKMVEVQ